MNWFDEWLEKGYTYSIEAVSFLDFEILNRKGIKYEVVIKWNGDILFKDYSYNFEVTELILDIVKGDWRDKVLESVLQNLQ